MGCKIAPVRAPVEKPRDSACGILSHQFGAWRWIRARQAIENGQIEPIRRGKPNSFKVCLHSCKGVSGASAPLRGVFKAPHLPRQASDAMSSSTAMSAGIEAPRNDESAKERAKRAPERSGTKYPNKLRGRLTYHRAICQAARNLGFLGNASPVVHN